MVIIFQGCEFCLQTYMISHSEKRRERR